MRNLTVQPKWILVLLFCCAGWCISAQPASAQVVINEVYGGGGNTGAIYSSDFVELYNTSGTAVMLVNHSVQYQSSAGPAWTVGAPLAAVTIPANGYYLIRLTAAGANGAALPTPDLVGSVNMSGATGKVALVAQTGALSSGCPSTYVDLVAYGSPTLVCREGTQNAPTQSAAVSSQRVVDGFDSNENGDDFANITPTPRNSTMAPPTISDIPDQTIAVDGTTGAINFTVGDSTTPAASLTVNGVSDNQTLVPNANIVFGGAGASRTVTVTPAAGQSGAATITVTVTDSDNMTTIDTFVLFVGAPPLCLAGSEVSVTPGAPATNGGVTLYASAQTAVQATVDTQDDDWRTGAAAVGLTTFGPASGLSSTNNSAQQTLSDGVRAYTISTREMTNGVNSPPCNGVNISVGRNVASNNSALQAAAPRPTVAAIGSTVFSYSETLGGLSPNSGFRNGLLLEFDSNQAAFGGWFGDAEGRSDSTPITVRLFDANGERLGGDFLVNETATPYGNATTRWIGFVSTSANVRSMLVMVGDDDVISLAQAFLSPQQGQGFSEHLGFIGGTFANSPTASAVNIGGYVLTERGRAPRGAFATLTDLAGNERSAAVNRWGHYSFGDIAAGRAYLLSVHAKGYNFSPATVLITPNFDLEELDFTALPAR